MVAFIMLLITACHMFFMLLALLSLFSLAFNSFQIRSIPERKWTRLINAASGSSARTPILIIHSQSVFRQAKILHKIYPRFSQIFCGCWSQGLNPLQKCPFPTQRVTKCNVRIAIKICWPLSLEDDVRKIHIVGYLQCLTQLPLQVQLPLFFAVS